MSDNCFCISLPLICFFDDISSFGLTVYKDDEEPFKEVDFFFDTLTNIHVFGSNIANFIVLMLVCCFSQKIIQLFSVIFTFQLQQLNFTLYSALEISTCGKYYGNIMTVRLYRCSWESACICFIFSISLTSRRFVDIYWC